MELLPQIAVRDHHLVHGKGDPLALAQDFAGAGATSVMLRDVDGSYMANPAGTDALGVIVAAASVPMHLDVATADPRAIERAARTRVASVVISMEGIFEPMLVRWALDTLGPGRTVLEVCADGEYLFDPPEAGFDMHVSDAVRAAARAGVSRVLLRDVTATVPSFERIARICSAAEVSITYSGPISSASDLRTLRHVRNGLDAVVVGEPLYDGRLSVRAALAAVAGVE